MYKVAEVEGCGGAQIHDVHELTVMRSSLELNCFSCFYSVESECAHTRCSCTLSQSPEKCRSGALEAPRAFSNL